MAEEVPPPVPSPPMVEEVPPAPSSSPSPPLPSTPWHTYISEDLPRTVQESADTAIRSARSLQHSSSTQLRSLQESIPQIESRYRSYENAFVQKIKDEVMRARENPVLAGGVAVTAALLLMRGPRRFLFRHTLGRLQSEEAQFVRAERNVNELGISVELMKKESKKLLERSTLAEKDMRRGFYDIKSAGTQIQSLSRLVYKAEAEAADLMDLLRELPTREALKLRADVASMSSLLRQQRTKMDKRVMKISDLGVPV